jgi:hypothetical protein
VTSDGFNFHANINVREIPDQLGGNTTEDPASIYRYQVSTPIATYSTITMAKNEEMKIVFGAMSFGKPSMP